MSLVAREFEKLAAVLPGISGHAPRLSALAQALDEALDTIQTEDEALKLTASEGNRPRIL